MRDEGKEIRDEGGGSREEGAGRRRKVAAEEGFGNREIANLYYICMIKVRVVSGG